MNRNMPEPGNPVIVRKRNKKNDPGTGSGKTDTETTNGRSKGMEQEHGTDAAAICKGVLLRIGMAAAMSTAVLGFLSYQVLPRLRKTDYIKMVSDADAQTALTLAPLVLLAICCLCVYPLIGHGKRSRTDAAAVACTVASFVLLGAGMVNMAVEKTMTPPLTVSIFLFCLMLAHTTIAGMKTALEWVGHGDKTDPARLTFIWGVIVFAAGLIVH